MYLTQHYLIMVFIELFASHYKSKYSSFPFKHYAEGPLLPAPPVTELTSESYRRQREATCGVERALWCVLNIHKCAFVKNPAK